MMKKILIALFLLMLLMGILYLKEETADQPRVSKYILENYEKDTGAGNAVTAVYLYYRVYDTLFEALLLLISIIGIIYFSRHEGDY